MTYWTAGRINRRLLEKHNINPLAFEYIESFLYSIKYIKSSPYFYFPSFDEFAGDRGEIDIAIKSHNYKSPVESNWHLIAIEIEKTLEEGETGHLKELCKFYKAWYEKEVDNRELQRTLNLAQTWTLFKRDVYRINIVKLVENQTLIVPMDCFKLRILSIDEVAK